MLTGNATLILRYPSETILGGVAPKTQGRYTVCLGYDLKAGGGAANIPGVVGGAAAAVAAVATKNYDAAIGSIGSAVSSLVPSSGQIGGGISGPSPDLTDNPRSVATYWYPIDFNVAELGRPSGAVMKLSDIPGYVQTARAQLAIPGHAEEMSEINALLDSGIFYE